MAAIQGGPDTPVDSGNALLAGGLAIGNTIAQGIVAKNAAKAAGKSVKSNSTTILLLAGGGGLFILLIVAMFAFRRK